MSYLPTQLYNWIAGDERYWSKDYSFNKTGALYTFLLQTYGADSLLTPQQIEDVKVAGPDRVFNLKAIQKAASPQYPARAIAPVATPMNTDVLAFTFGTDVRVIEDWPTLDVYNMFKNEEFMKRKMRGTDDAVALYLDSLCVANLEANKQLVAPKGLSIDYTFDVPSATVRIPKAAGDAGDAFMSVRDFLDVPSQQTIIVCNKQMMHYIRKALKYGASNSKNEEQFVDSAMFVESDNVINGGGAAATGYVVASGAVAALFTKTSQLIAGKNKDDWRTLPFRYPISGIFASADIITDVTDMSTYTTYPNDNANVETKVQITTHPAFINGYLTTPATAYRPIVKFEIRTT